MPDSVVVPGARDVRASLDGPDAAEACVVACPPHPQFGGDRHDGRLRAVADALDRRGLACLRFDYGPWDEGSGECTDAANALAWATDRFDSVGLFGYSFGAAVALSVAAGDRAGSSAVDPLCAVAVLAPPPRSGDLVPLSAVAAVDAPLLVCHGTRDETVDWDPVVEAAREAGATVESVDADHFFAGAERRIAETVATFLDGRCD